jgi:glycosyltransferase involved in cell wall biosynthesis
MANALMVPSHWNKTIFRQCGVTPPIWVIPYICEEPSQETISKKRWRIPTRDYLFYTINVWSERKANLKTIGAYLKAFTDKDDVTLLIKTGIRDDTKFKPGPFWRYFQSLLFDNVYRSMIPLLRKFPSPARIMLIPKFLKDKDIRFIHQRGDCYVSLCRSEGWGMGAFDAATRGKPVIMTGYGGQVDFLSPDMAYLVDFRLVPVKTLSSSYTSNQHWAEPDVDHGAQLMRRVYENKEQASHKGTQLKAYICENFRTDKISKQLEKALMWSDHC